MLVPVKWLVALVSAILGMFSPAPQKAAPTQPPAARAAPAPSAQLAALSTSQAATTLPQLAPATDQWRQFRSARFIRVEQLQGGGVRIIAPPQLPL